MLPLKKERGKWGSKKRWVKQERKKEGGIQGSILNLHPVKAMFAFMWEAVIDFIDAFWIESKKFLDEIM